MGGGCESCGCLTLDEQLLRCFGVRACRGCSSSRHDGPGGDDFRLLTKTVAKETFLCQEWQLRPLGFLEKPNPRKGGWGCMQLFLTRQLRASAEARFGGAAGLAAEHERREEARRARKEGAAKKKKEAERAARRKRKQAGADAPPPTSLAALFDVDSEEEEEEEEVVEAQKGKKKAKREVIQLASASDHVHRFISEKCIDADNDLWEKSCECGYTKEFERF